MTMITPSYLGETIEYSSLHACRSTLEDPTGDSPVSRASAKLEYFDSEDEECTQVGEHIHDKLLKHGLSHRQAVVVLYGASAAFGLVSLSLISASLTLVAVSLTIVGVSVAFGLQRLGYREMDEIWRVARSTWQQKTIISNNLAVWRATDHLATATTPQDVSCILKTAFQETDYDGFEYSFTPKAVFREKNVWKAPNNRARLAQRIKQRRGRMDSSSRLSLSKWSSLWTVCCKP